MEHLKFKRFLEAIHRLRWFGRINPTSPFSKELRKTRIAHLALRSLLFVDEDVHIISLKRNKSLCFRIGPFHDNAHGNPAYTSERMMAPTCVRSFALSHSGLVPGMPRQVLQHL
jgi:hypothetical protein